MIKVLGMRKDDIEIFRICSLTSLCESRMSNMCVHYTQSAQMQHLVINIARSVRVVLSLIEVFTSPWAAKANSFTLVEKDERNRN